MSGRDTNYLKPALDAFSEQMAKLRPELISDGALQTAKFGTADTIGVTLLVFLSPALRYCMHLLAFRA